VSMTQCFPSCLVPASYWLLEETLSTLLIDFESLPDEIDSSCFLSVLLLKLQGVKGLYLVTIEDLFDVLAFLEELLPMVDFLLDLRSSEICWLAIDVQVLTKEAQESVQGS
jgi:hypothetical protein